MDAFGYISSEVFTRLKPSKISGIGVFAVRDIPSSSKIFEPWLGETGNYPITEDQLSSLPYDLYHHIKSIFYFHPDFPKNTDTFVRLTNGCHWIYTTPYYFVNSSSNFNFNKDSFETTRDIKAGQEITSNYQRYARNEKSIL